MSRNGRQKFVVDWVFLDLWFEGLDNEVALY